MQFGFGGYYIDVNSDDLLSIREFIRRLRVPKNKADKIGIVIAIKTEQDKDKLRLENDLVAQLTERINSSENRDQFFVIKYPNSISKRISDTSSAYKYLLRSRAHLVVYGHLVERKVGGVNNYVFRLHGLVRHIPLNPQAKGSLQKDFSASLPGRFRFPEGQELIGFDLTQDYIKLVVKFIVGCAALLSRDPNLAYQLFKEVQSEVKSVALRGPVIEEIEKRNTARLVQAIEIKTNMLYEKYTLTRDENFLLQGTELLGELQTLEPDNVYAHNSRAMLLFKQSQIMQAIDELKKIHIADGIVQYNLGFLYAYVGDLPKALESYRKAGHKIVEPAALNDIDIFLTEEIQKNPNLVQLYFFRGYLNYRGKSDYLSAKKDFEDFCERAHSPDLDRLKELATKYLSEISQTGLS